MRCWTSRLGLRLLVRALIHSIEMKNSQDVEIVNPGASNRLSTSLNTPNVTYDGSEAISVFASEARQENG